MQERQASSEMGKNIQYSSVDDLLGKIEGIERTILIEDNDTLLNTIEKIALVPDTKLVLVKKL